MKMKHAAMVGFVMALAGLAVAQDSQNPPKPTTTPSKGQPVPVPNPIPTDDNGGLLFADPTIQFEKLEFDFGKIFDNQPVEAEFKFTNSGGGALVITNVQTSCGCTTPDWDKQRKQYNAGETGVIKARFDPAHKTGMQTKTITVETNDRANPRVVLSIKTNITPLVQLEPTYLAFEPIQKGAASTKIVKVTGRREDFKVNEVIVSPTDVFSARVLGTKKVEVNGEMLSQTEIEVSIKPGAAVGRASATMQIKTNDERSAQMPLGMNGEVLGDLVVTPNQLLLGVVAPGAPFSGEVKIARRDGKSWALKGSELRPANANDPVKIDIKAEATKSEKGDFQTIKVSGVAPEQAGYRYTGELVLATDIPGEEAVRIRVLMTVRPNPGQPAAPGPNVGPIANPAKNVKGNPGLAPAGKPEAAPTATPK